MGRIDVTITGTAGTYATTVVPDPAPATPFEDLDIFFDATASDISDAEFFIRFYKEKTDPDKKKYMKGCLLGGDGAGKHKSAKSGKFHKIAGKVESTPHHTPKSFFYEIWYTSGTTDYRLVDPEIVVEGDPSGAPEEQISAGVVIVDVITATAGTVAITRAARKSSKKKAAKKKPAKKKAAKKAARKNSTKQRTKKKSAAKKPQAKNAKRPQRTPKRKAKKR